MTVRGLIAVLFGTVLVMHPVAAQRTIEIPEEHIKALPGIEQMPVPQFDFDLSSPEGLFGSLEQLLSTDWTGTLPEVVIRETLGGLPFRAQAPVVWEMRATGSWNETLSGGGTLNVLDQTVTGAAQGSQFHAQLETDSRDWPLQLFAFVPGAAPEVVRVEFSGTGDGRPGGGTGIGAIANHLFERQRVLGHATPQGMTARGFDETIDADFAGDYLYTEVQGGRIRVDRAGNGYRIRFSATVREFRRNGHQPTGQTARLSGWICEAAAYAKDPDACAFEELEIIDYTPPTLRANVNPEHPAVTVSFNTPVDIASLAENFVLYTVDADGQPMEVAGEWRTSPRPGAWREAAAERVGRFVQMAQVAQMAPQSDRAVCSERNRTGLALHTSPNFDHYDDPREYAFHPDQPLRSGTRYEAILLGGEDGVRALDGDSFLEQGHRWVFNTLLQMAAQPPVDQDHPLRLRVFQTVRDPALVTDKPALTRLTPDWQPHDDIAADWQAESFEFELVLSEYHPRVVAQGGTLARVNRFARLEPQDAFTAEDRRHARNTVNFFGWLPQHDSADRLEVVACPNDPFPHAMPAAEIRQSHRIEIWDHDPGDLDFYYVIAEVGVWSSALEQWLRKLFELTRAPVEGSQATTHGLLALAIDLITRETDLSEISLETFAEMGGASQDAFLEPFQEIIDLLSKKATIEGGLSDADRVAIEQTLRLTEYYATQFLPYRSATGHALGGTVGSFGLYVSSQLDLGAFYSERFGGSAVGSAVTPDDFRELVRIGAYVRWLQRLVRDHIGPDDFVVIVLPGGFLEQWRHGVSMDGLQELDVSGFLYKGLLDYRSRAVAMVIFDDQNYPPDTLATGLVHEFGHSLLLQHSPPMADPLIIRNPRIDGFRLASSGLHGWNKSYEEGNAEHPVVLRSLMWPDLQPSPKVWLSPEEYAQAQRDIERGIGPRSAGPGDPATRLAQVRSPDSGSASSIFSEGRIPASTRHAAETGASGGQAVIGDGRLMRTAWQRQSPIRLAQAPDPARAGDSGSLPVDQLIVTGMIAPEGGGAWVDLLRTRTAPRLVDSEGAYRAELLDAQGRILRSAAFDPDTRAPHPFIAPRLGGSGPDNPLFWPEFRVALDPHRDAVALRIRKGTEELALIETAGGIPSLSIETQGPVAIGPEDSTIRWTAEADGRVLFDVEYSPNGGARWRPLATYHPHPTITLNAGDLAPGPRPLLRITAQSGLHAVRQELPVVLNRAPEPVSVFLPDPESALNGVPPTLRFETDLRLDELENHLSLLGEAGEALVVDFVHMPAQRSVSLMPLHPLAPGATYTLRLAAGLRDAFGNRLHETIAWNFDTAEALPHDP